MPDTPSFKTLDDSLALFPAVTIRTFPDSRRDGPLRSTARRAPVVVTEENNIDVGTFQNLQSFRRTAASAHDFAIRLGNQKPAQALSK
jgi:hypothetical protein